LLKPVVVSAPAKLVLTGEYAVLEPDHLAVVAAVDRDTEAQVAPDPIYRLTAPALDLDAAPAGYDAGCWALREAHPHAGFVTEALSVTLRYLEEGGVSLAPFHLRLSPALAEGGIKVGLGGSAATTVAAVAAVLEAFGAEADPGVVYRLGAIAHLQAQGSGSGIDVAASAYGGLLAFSSHHPEWLKARLEAERSVRALVEGPWPHLRIERLSWPSDWRLMVGWTGKSASTPAYLQRVAALKEAGDPRYPQFLEAMQASSRLLMRGLEASDAGLCLQALELGREAMLDLGQALGVSLETPMLTRLAEAAAGCQTAGKPSGSGGGDCGIALAFDPAQALCLREAWQAVGVRPLEMAIAPQGVRALSPN
jgi:phosphomevalonate kinase